VREVEPVRELAFADQKAHEESWQSKNAPARNRLN
jgi:hypothetical protein